MDLNLEFSVCRQCGEFGSHSDPAALSAGRQYSLAGTGHAYGPLRHAFKPARYLNAESQRAGLQRVSACIERGDHEAAYWEARIVAHAVNQGRYRR